MKTHATVIAIAMLMSFLLGYTLQGYVIYAGFVGQYAVMMEKK
jgi:hypothetical protein